MMKLPEKLRLLLVPLAVLLWLIGWTMFWTGSKKSVQQKEREDLDLIPETESL